MKSYYRICSKCKGLKSYLTYYLSKEENKLLSKKNKLLCYECYIKIKEEKRMNKLLAQLYSTDENGMTLFSQYVDVLHYYNDITKEEYDNLKEKINDRLETFLH